jgi:hypothetical protein
MNDCLKEKSVRWTIERFATDEDLRVNRPYATSLIEGNLLLNAGINLLWSLVCGGAGVAFDNAAAVLGVGDSTSPASVEQTGLQAPTNLAYGLMDDGYPTYGADQTATWRTTFGSTEANFAWQEFVVFNGTGAAAVALNRKVSSQGTKVAGESWRLSLSIVLA